MLQGFYAIVDVTPLDLAGGPGAGVEAAVRKAGPLLRARPCMLQLRAKTATAAQMLAAAEALRPLCWQHRVPLCVNDRLDVALAAEANAVHLGQDDLPLPAALRLLRARGSGLQVGVSTHSFAQAAQAVADGADYIGFGPIFPTATKANPDPVVGTQQLAKVAAELQVPAVAIGGITLATLPEVVATGVPAAAIVGAVCNAEDPEAAARSVNEAFRRARG